MKKILFLIAFTIVSVSISAQNEASNWYFGDNAGISFNPDGSITPVTGQLSTDEGCTSISDGSGNLLFYTDGILVYDRNGDLMLNGTGLHGSPSSTQSAIIIPKPLDNDIYYIFTVDTNSFDNTDLGFKYSEVDMTRNGGLGEVTQKNITLLQDSSEKISAVLKDCQTEAIWVVTLANQFGTLTNPFAFDTFHAFEVTDTGVNTTAVTSPAGVTVSNQRGYLKFSPDGEKLACANTQGGLFIYDFDLTTGMVDSSPTSPQQLTINASNGAVIPYGLEFSPNNQYLYVSSSNDFFNQANPAQNEVPANHFSSLVQFDLAAADIQSSQILINQRNGYRSALQSGPDGKIYRSTSATYNQGLPFLSVINNPNELGAACDYVDNQIPLSNNSRQGLPPFIASFFSETIDIINDPEITTTFLPLCEGESYTLTADNIADATYTWSFDGVAQPTPPIPYEFEVFQNGLYEVLIELNTGDCERFEGQALVEYSPFPEAYTPPKIDECDDALNDGVFRFDLSQQNAVILGGQDPSEYTVHYYASEQDAIDDENELPTFYENTTNPEEIFVRVENVNNENCFRTIDENTGLTVSFFIEVFDDPTVIRPEDIDECDLDGDTTDGVITIDLAALIPSVLGPDQNPMQFTVTYHDTDAAAQTGANPLPNSYQNVPFNDEVFIRIENNNNTDCFDVDSFLITVNLTPEVNDIGLFQCDEDGTPDGRTLFNILEKEEDITGGNPDFSVEYFLNQTDADAGGPTIDASNFNNTSNPQIVIAKVTDTTSGCFSYSEITLEASATSANDAYLGVCDTDDIEDGFVEFDLSEADAQVLNGLPAGLDLVYYGTLDDALLEINPLPNNFTNTEESGQTIFVRVENDNNCYGINEVELEVLTLPNVEIMDEVLYCLNNFPEPIVINGGVINDIPNNYYYDWSTDETTIEIEVNEPGTYTVTVSNVAGCSKERTVIVRGSDVATINNIEVTDASENNTVTVLVNNPDEFEFSLDNPNGLYQDSNVFENVRPGIYTVYVRDKDGCGITEDMVSVVGFPKFFTPNGDNQNDFWQVKGISSQFQPDTIIYIFDRHGKLLSEINPLGSGWDGNYNGNPMPSSDYWFSVTLQDGRRFSSHFALKR
ncbi:T9SS type B sorting domain-containing protein [Winogradskyella jejuensis]|uniref:Gliding motility-associated C-terminal domain-containing protein n=1 Tax=Winogradskyella jejuensis TaxID=1089305 RepID=A0A1M5JWF9_9FLAO|nr:T9SS type B sorting domain-containing protein [Winogradskyella jejuensis]SHG44878.1 gliding motility-associated C-terminal domain-containing protein [Winogradskyella jejuensis]